MASEGLDPTWTWAAFEPEPTEHERALFDRFVEEYLVDFDHIAAASRVGFMADFAPEYGKLLIQKSYVQRKIRALQEMHSDPKAEADYNKRQIIAALRREAHDKYNKGSTRVAALAQLKSIYGLDAPTKSQSTVTHQGGVMMVPAIANLDEWEAAAQASQSKLAQDSRVD